MEEWCDCPDAPVHARRPLTLLNHSDDCGYPATRCAVEGHRRLVHKDCGRLLQMRFCGCRSDYGYTFDRDRGWWVHYVCGWPTRAWFEGSGSPAPEHLAGLKPLTWHEFDPVPRTPKAAWARLSDGQRALNDGWAGRWLWD